MKQLLEDLLYTLNQLPNRKVNGKEWTTYDLAKRVEKQIESHTNMLQSIDKVLEKLQDNNLED